jgi:hypothetical protein
MVAPPTLVVNDLEISIKYFPIKVTFFVILTLNITLYLSPGIQRALFACQAVAWSGLAVRQIGSAMRWEKKTSIACFLLL